MWQFIFCGIGFILWVLIRARAKNSARREASANKIAVAKEKN
jgi:hypothetical protein